MKKVLVVLMVIAAAQGAWAGEWFTSLNGEEAVAETAFVALALFDWNQTLQIAKHPKEYHETNFVIGEHPSPGRVNLLMPAGIIAHVVITYALPRKYRPFWQYVWVGEEAACVYQNWRSGLTVRF